MNGETDEIAVGALTLELVSMQPLNFDRYFHSLKPEIINGKIDYNFHYHDEHMTNEEHTMSARNPWFNEFWESRFGCNLLASPQCTNYQLNVSNWDSKLQFIVDATYVFANALHMYLNCTSTACNTTSLKNINGTKLFHSILERTFISKLLIILYCQIDFLIIIDKFIVAKEIHFISYQCLIMN